MQPSTISWSNLVKIKSGSPNYNVWPTICTPIQKNILNKNISLVNTTVLQTLQTQPSRSNNSDQTVASINSLVDGIEKVGFELENKKSREEIVAERKQRKLAAKLERQKRALDQKLNEICSLKSQKIQIIDNKFLENYNKCNANSNPSKQCEDQLERISVSKVTTKNRIKLRLKNKNTISVSLMELIETKQLQKSNEQSSKLGRNKSVILSNPTIKRHRGKQREFQKAKPLKRFKRSILANRSLRGELHEEGIPNDGNEMKLELNSSSIKYSRKFRPYCDHYATTEINTAVESLLKDLFRFQKRAYEKNQVKGSSKRRYVVGFNEVRRHLELKKVKLLIIAPDLEPNEGLGGLDEAVHKFKLISQMNDIPYVFAASRWRIGKFLFKKVPVSCVAILNYDGACEQYKRVLELVSVEREAFIKDSVMKYDVDNK